MTGRPSVSQLIEGVRAGHRAMIARAITLCESTNAAHREDARTLLQSLQPFAGQAQRIGISGVPGVGKSTFIERFGLKLLDADFRVAVLAVDPTSGRTGGSILGDKTRMDTLAADPRAYIRPSPSAGMLGGVARATQESILILEAAGFDLILVETVGTGQSETMVSEMVDLFLLLMLPGAGDDLQGIKKGIVELADVIAVNKVDALSEKVNQTVRDYKAALRILADADPSWHPPVLPVSGLTGAGLDDLWSVMCQHQKITTATSRREARRQQQRVSWFRRLLSDALMMRLKDNPQLLRALEESEKAVHSGHMTPSIAVDTLLDKAFQPQTL